MLRSYLWLTSTLLECTVNLLFLPTFDVVSVFIMLQDEKELCLATAQFEDFVLQFMDRFVNVLLMNILITLYNLSTDICTFKVIPLFM